MRLFNSQNLPTCQDAIGDPAQIIFYFAILRDKDGKKLVAVRRAVQFKGILQAKGRLIRWLDDTMRVVADDVFKLDEEFDYFVTDNDVYILRPSAFEYTADIDERVLAKATDNTQQLQQVMAFVAFDGLAAYVSTHKRAARLVAAIRSRRDLHCITKPNLMAACSGAGVEIEDVNGRLRPVHGHEMNFLMLLDRRRYTVELIEDTPEVYEAASRRKG